MYRDATTSPIPTRPRAGQVVDEGDLDLPGMLAPGDLVVAAQGVGEPRSLLAALTGLGPDHGDVEVFVGMSLDDGWRTRSLGGARWLTWGGVGAFSGHIGPAGMAVLPTTFVALPRALTSRGGERLAVMLQVAPADHAGRYSLGLACDFAVELLSSARLVIAEVNERMPPVAGPDLPATAFDVLVPVSTELPTMPSTAPSPVAQAVAGHVAKLVPANATIQVGVGEIVGALGTALTGHRGLRVHTAILGDWFLKLLRAGAIADEPGAVRFGAAAGSTELYATTPGTGALVTRIADIGSPGALAAIPRFVTVNGALQVDLTGQVNAESIDGRQLGAIGGQPDFARGAQASPGGLSIITLPATAKAGSISRIVDRLDSGLVTTPRSAVDLVVTEYGVADLRGRTLTERAQAMVAVAAPQHRAVLAKALPP